MNNSKPKEISEGDAKIAAYKKVNQLAMELMNHPVNQDLQANLAWETFPSHKPWTGFGG